MTDIARAVLAGYPKEKYDRLLNRRRKCMDILTKAKLKAGKHGNHAEHESEDEQQQTSQKGPEQQSERDSGAGGGDADQDQTKRELTVDFDKRYESPLPKLSDKPDDNFWNMSCALELKSDGEKGRHFAAKRDIAPGEFALFFGERSEFLIYKNVRDLFRGDPHRGTSIQHRVGRKVLEDALPAVSRAN